MGGVPIVRRIAFCGLYGNPRILGSYHIGLEGSDLRFRVYDVGLG